MNDETAGQDTAASAEPARGLRMLKVFMKDLSFEVPRGFAAFQDLEHTLKKHLDLRATYTLRPEDMVEVVLHVHLHVLSRDLVSICLIELQQGGLFEIRGCTDEERKQIVGSECVAALYPFAREVIWSVLNKGGFPGALLGPLDLNALLVNIAESNAESGNENDGEHAQDRASA